MRPICHNLPMCGRYRLSRRKQMIEEYFGSVSGEGDGTPRCSAMSVQTALRSTGINSQGYVSTCTPVTQPWISDAAKNLTDAYTESKLALYF
jgi:hypothetical protein